MKRSRAFRSHVLLPAASILFSTCASSDGRAPTARAFTILLESAPYEIDPRVAITSHGLKISQLIFCGLTRIDEKLNVIPDLAERWEIADDGRTVTFFLRSGIKFHDGQPVTARDVKFTYDTLLDERFGSRYHGVYRDKIRSVDALDDHTVRFRLHHAQAPFLADVTTGIVPAHLGGATRDARVKFESILIGSGPFKFVSRAGDDLVTLAANPHHHTGPPNLSHLSFRVVRNEVTRYLELVKGDADLVQNALSPLYLPLITSNPALHVESAPSIILTYMVFNTRSGPLADVRVRRAIAHAIDRRAIIAAKMRGNATVARAFLSDAHPFTSPDITEIPFDRDRARTLLDEAGYTLRGATRFRLTYKTSTDRFRLSIARVIAMQLREVGVEIDVRPYEFGTFFADIRKGAFEIASMQWPEFDEPDALHMLFHSSRIPTPDNPHVARFAAAWTVAHALPIVANAHGSPAAPIALPLALGVPPPADGSNRAGYLSAEVDALLATAQRTFDSATRRALYTAAERALMRDLPMLPLWHEHNIAITRRKVVGLKPQPNGKLYMLRNVALAPDAHP
ncbi:MAG: ABC transporter substrate-binding protein [Deltaproteobacteria bacterium]|nr:ABC transporter substrate-binding protein [Deltaproteobacteria bacterium]